MNVNLRLPPKFFPHLLGHEQCTAREGLHEEIQQAFAARAETSQANIAQTDGWLFKAKRMDLLTTDDTHLYRVRKAKKVRDYIRENGLEEHFVVPEKYIYLDRSSSSYYAACEKLDLSDEVVTPDALFEEGFKFSGRLHGGQARALSDGAPKRNLTAIQAKALAELCILGYTDVSYNNFFFTRDGKVAILDTEPQKRGLKKAKSATLWNRFLNDKQALLAKQALSAMSKLTWLHLDPQALRNVQHVATCHALLSIAKVVGKVALACLAVYSLPAVLPLLPAVAWVKSLVYVVSLALKVKAVLLAKEAWEITFIWWLSRHDNRLRSMQLIPQKERSGAF